MTKEEYNELKTMAVENILPLANHRLGCYACVEEIRVGDGERCGEEVGFRLYLRLGAYFKQPKFYDREGYAWKKAVLEQAIEEAREARAKVTEAEEKCMSDYMGKDMRPDGEISADGWSQYWREGWL